MRYSKIERYVIITILCTPTTLLKHAVIIPIMQIKTIIQSQLSALLFCCRRLAQLFGAHSKDGRDCPNKKTDTVVSRSVLQRNRHRPVHYTILYTLETRRVRKWVYTTSGTVSRHLTHKARLFWLSVRSFRNQECRRAFTMNWLPFAALLVCSLVMATKETWQRPGCHKVGHTRKISIPDCIEFHITTNACRGFCPSYAVPSLGILYIVNLPVPTCSPKGVQQWPDHNHQPQYDHSRFSIL